MMDEYGWSGNSGRSVADGGWCSTVGLGRLLVSFPGESDFLDLSELYLQENKLQHIIAGQKNINTRNLWEIKQCIYTYFTYRSALILETDTVYSRARRHPFL